MELRLPMLHIFIVFRENNGKENCAQVLEEEVNKMFGIKSLNDEHDYNVVSMNYLNIHDANDMQSHKLGDAMFDEDDIFSPPRFDVQIYYNGSMPPIYDDYNDESGFGEVMTLFSDESTILDEASIDYDNKFPIYVLKFLKLHLFCLPMLVDSCSHELFAHKIPMHRNFFRLKCACHV